MDRTNANLATVQKILELRPIEGADKIECAKVLGWECVVKKGDFKVGDLVVYIEIDSIVPETSVFEFLRDKKFRIRTVRLRGQVSQGLVLPLSSFPEIKNPQEGQDVTAILGITKYDPPEVEYSPSKSSQSKKKPWWFYVLIRIPLLRRLVLRKVGDGGAFPSHLVPKTDETRLQAFAPDFLEKYKDLKVSISQKMDGTSLTIIWHKGKVSVASRNVWFPTYRSNKYWEYVKGLGLEKVLKRNAPVAIQGELCGPGIQGNKYNLDKMRLFVFNVYDINRGEYLAPTDLKSFVGYLRQLTKCRTLDLVDTLAHDVTLGSIATTVEGFVKFASTKSRLNPDTWNEGIVVRSMDNKPYGVEKMCGKRFSFKVISPEFLLQYGL